MRNVRLYGRASGHGSHAVVTENFDQALANRGLLAGVVELDFDDGDLDAPSPAGATARSAVFTGPLTFMRRMRLEGRHERRYAMVAPNSTCVPRELQHALTEHATDVLVPSRWAAGIVSENVKLPVHVVPHGVTGFSVNAEERQNAINAYRSGFFNILHLSTSLGERKGTRALIEGFRLAKERQLLPSRAKLVLVLDVQAYGSVADLVVDQLDIVRASRLDASPAVLSAVYSGQHVICQPSRGEGFGMCPLEALASGVPVVATACTGHSEWFAENLASAVRVEHGELSPIDDGPDALGPTVEPEAVAQALDAAYSGYERLFTAALDGASAIREQWSWSAQLAPFMEELAK